MRGENVDPARGLFIKPHLGEQLAQPDRRENEVTGKTKLLKRDEDEVSPDLYDATVLAFARDSQYGLRARS